MSASRVSQPLSALILLITIFLAGCITDKTPTGPTDTDEIDPAIVGSWIHKELNTAVGSPPESISGIEISERGGIETLSIETATGRLVRTNSPSPGFFFYASNGRCVLQANRIGFSPGGTYHSTYNVENSRLIFDKHNGKIPILHPEYARARIGEVVTQPIHSYFEMIFRDTILINSPVASAPSAYASYLTSNNQPFLLIRARSGHHHLIIHIEDFQGTGAYTLGSNTYNFAEYVIWAGDVGIPYVMTKPNAGNVTLDMFDLNAGTCSGYFGFRVEFYGETRRIGGHFEIPVYD